MESDQFCIDHLRMDRRCFMKLCNMLKTIEKLTASGDIRIEEMVAMFLNTIGHHSKNRSVQLLFRRSGSTISRHFNAVLHAILYLHEILLKKPEPVLENSIDDRWRWFKVGIIFITIV